MTMHNDNRVTACSWVNEQAKKLHCEMADGNVFTVWGPTALQAYETLRKVAMFIYKLDGTSQTMKEMFVNEAIMRNVFNKFSIEVNDLGNPIPPSGAL